MDRPVVARGYNPHGGEWMLRNCEILGKVIAALSRRAWLALQLGIALAAAVGAVPTSAGADSKPEATESQEAYTRTVEWMLDFAIEDGRAPEALRLGRQLLARGTALRDSIAELHAHLALASVFSAMELGDSSYAHASLAVRLAGLLPNSHELGSALLALGEALDARGEVDSADVVTTRAGPVALAEGDSTTAGTALLFRGRRLLRTGPPAQALALADSSLSCLSLLYPTARAAALTVAGRSLATLGRDSEASMRFEGAFALLIESRGRVLDRRGAVSMMEGSRTLFSTWEEVRIRLDRSAGHPACMSALAVAERGRAQGLLDLIEPLRVLAPIDSVRFDFVANPRRRLQPGPDSSTEVRRSLARLMGKGRAVLYYSQLPDSLLIWILRPGLDALLTARLPARFPESAAPAAVASIEPTTAPSAALAWWNSRASTVGRDSLLKAFARICLPDTVLSMLAGLREVVIVPDGWVNEVPFAALPTGHEGTPFGILHALRFAPSLEVLEEAEDRCQARTAGTRLTDALVIGNPVTPSVALPGAESEARFVAAALGARPILRDAATESLLVSRWSLSPIIHLATHGTADADPTTTLDSSLVLVTPGGGFDGRVRASQVFSEFPPSKAQLVVLSACQSAYGGLSPSEGIMGLPWALLANGASSVMASMWSLRDQSTGWLIQHFYTHLLRDADHPSVSEALRLAMIDTRRVTKWRDPVYWAAFKVYGADWRVGAPSDSTAGGHRQRAGSPYGRSGARPHGGD